MTKSRKLHMDEAVELMLLKVVCSLLSLREELRAMQLSKLGIRRMTIISEHKGVINFHLTRDGNELKIGSAKFNSVVYNSIWYQTLFCYF